MCEENTMFSDLPINKMALLMTAPETAWHLTFDSMFFESYGKSGLVWSVIK